MSFDFTRLNDSDLERQLIKVCEQEKIGIEDDALKQILTLADGGVRDALSILDQLYSYCGSYIAYEDVIKVFGLVAKNEMIDFLENIFARNTNIVLNKLYNYNEVGVNIKKLNEDIIVVLKDTLIYKTTSNYSILHILNESEAQYLSSRVEIDKLNWLIDTFIKCSNEFRYAANIRSFYEIVILKVSASNIEDQMIEYKSENTEKEVKNVAKPQHFEEKQVVVEKISEEDIPLVNEIKKVMRDEIMNSKPAAQPILTKKDEYKEPRKVESLDPSLSISFDDEIIMRALSKSSKEIKQQLFAKWSKLNDLTIEPEFNQFVPQLKNVTLFSFCDELLIVQSQFQSIINTINHKDNTDVLSKMIEYIYGSKVKIYAIDFSESSRLIKKYVNLQQVKKLPKLQPGESIYDK